MLSAFILHQGPTAFPQRPPRKSQSELHAPLVLCTPIPGIARLWNGHRCMLVSLTKQNAPEDQIPYLMSGSPTGLGWYFLKR